MASPHISLVSVKALAADELSYGTAFHLRTLGEFSYYLTCAHVVQMADVSDVTISVDGRPATIEAIETVCPSIRDLAVLRSSRIEAPEPELGFVKEAGYTTGIRGFQPHVPKTKKFMDCRALIAHLSQATQHGEDRVMQLDLSLIGDVRLNRGFSGSPVVLAATGTVVGVVYSCDDDGSHGTAVSIKELEKLSPPLEEELLQSLRIVAVPVSSKQARNVVEASWYEPVRSCLSSAPEIFAKLPIAKGFVPSSAYVGYAGEGVFQENIVEWLNAKLRIAVENDATTLLLGGYGSGKSSVLHVLARDLANAALKDYPNTPIPIYCRLDACRGKKTLAEGIAAYFAKFDSSVSTDAIQKLLKDSDRQVVLLLDGLDEYGERVDYWRIPELLALLENARGLPIRQLIISCRDTFFPSSADVNVVRPDEIVRLTPFTDAQMKSYLAMWQPPLPPETLQILEASPHLKEVFRSPIHLYLFCKHVSGLSPVSLQDAARGKSIVRRVDLYNSFVLETLSEDTVVAVRWPIVERRRFLGDLAYHWHDTSVSEWTLQELKSYMVANSGCTTTPNAAELTERANSIFNCSFFTRVGDRFRFGHKSFQEFLIAEQLADEMQTGRFSKWETPMYNEIYFFGAEFVRPTAEIVSRVFRFGSPGVQANFIATTYNTPSEHIDQALREQVIASPSSTVRHSAAQGLGHYLNRTRGALAESDRLQELLLDINAAHAAYLQEPNTVIRADLRMILSWSLRLPSVVHALGASSISAITDCVKTHEPIRRSDAEDILNITVAERILPLYRRSAIQSDERWPVICGSIFLLGAIRDTVIWPDIEALVRRSSSPEVQRASQDVQLGW